MNSVLTLVVDPVTASLAPSHLALARDALAAAGAHAGIPDWLATAIACDLPFDGDPASGLAAVRAALGGTAIDAYAQPAAGRRKKLLIADMDSTIVAAETLDELAAFAGIKDRIAATTAPRSSDTRSVGHEGVIPGW